MPLPPFMSLQEVLGVARAPGDLLKQTAWVFLKILRCKVA